MCQGDSTATLWKLAALSAQVGEESYGVGTQLPHDKHVMWARNKPLLLYVTTILGFFVTVQDFDYPDWYRLYIMLDWFKICFC